MHHTQVTLDSLSVGGEVAAPYRHLPDPCLDRWQDLHIALKHCTRPVNLVIPHLKLQDGKGGKQHRQRSEDVTEKDRLTANALRQLGQEVKARNDLWPAHNKNTRVPHVSWRRGSHDRHAWTLCVPCL